MMMDLDSVVKLLQFSAIGSFFFYLCNCLNSAIMLNHVVTRKTISHIYLILFF